MHYHLGLICTLCMDFFATSMDTMRWHMAAKDKDWEEQEVFENDDNGDEDDGYLLEEI